MREPVHGWVAQMRSALRPRRAPSPHGAYLWGPVGRGKTYLMDLFFAQAPGPRKTREHFYRFMRNVHAELKALGPARDPLEAVAANLASKFELICLDEFMVADIGDAMILGNLLQALFSRNVTLVMTSNSPPRELYKDGLQRQRFLPAIHLLETRLEVIGMPGVHDFRLRQLRQSGTYFDSSMPDSQDRLQSAFARLTHGTPVSHAPLVVHGRAIPIVARAGGVVWLEFSAACGSARSALDYIDVAQDFHTVLLTAIPVMDETADNAARRFIALIDELYDRGVKLIASAAAAPHALYLGTQLRADFERTASRLVQMQADGYLSSCHRAGVQSIN